MDDVYLVEAYALVGAIPLGVVGLVAGAVLWARDALRHAPVVGWVGLCLTAAAVSHLVVARQLGAAVNRPVLAAFLGDGAAQRAGVAGLAALAVAVVGTAAAVRLPGSRQALTSAR